MLHQLLFVIQQFSPMKLSYLPLERILVLIYWTMNILQSHISLIQYQIHQLVINFQHRLKTMCGSLLSMGKSLSQIMATLDELNSHQNPRGKSKFNISLFIRKNYQRIDLDEICSRFDQVVPMVSHN